MIHEKNDSNVSSFIQTTKPIDATVRIAKPGSVDDSDNCFDLPSDWYQKKMLYGSKINVEKPALKNRRLPKEGNLEKH